MTNTAGNPAFPQNNLRALRRARDLTMEQLATLTGTDASTINKLEKSRMRLSDRWIAPLAEALGVTPNELFGESVPASLPNIRTDVRPAEVHLPERLSMPADVPVLGTAAGSHLRGAFQLEPGNVIDYVRRAPALRGARNAYALYIEGSSMAPEHNHGDLRFIHPGRPYRAGDSVIVQVQLGPNEPVEASIGHYLKKTPTKFVIGKLNPIAEVELSLPTIIAAHKVLTLNELFGV